MQRVEIELPESVYRHLAKIAEETSQPIATLVAQSAIGNLPPSVDATSPELRVELLKMHTLETSILLRMAQAEITASQHERQIELLEKNQVSQLTAAESQELSKLRQVADQQMLHKAYAWSILRWRGQRVPTLQELPIPQ